MSTYVSKEDLIKMSQVETRRGVGLGDVIRSMTEAVGLKPCNGCEKRRRSLNRFQVRW